MGRQGLNKFMEERYLDAGGVRTCYIDRGTGPPVVLLHGAAVGVDANITWFRTIKALEDAFRVVAFDQIGFGHTDPPADGILKNRLERVDHAIDVLRSLDVSNACLVGHSEGAFMAARIAIVAPELASRIVLVTTGGTAPYLGGEADKAWMEASQVAYRTPGQFDSEDAYVKASGYLSRRSDPELEAIVRKNYRHAMSIGQHRLFETMPEKDADLNLYGELQKEFVLPFLRDLKIPILLVWATDDGTVPVERGLKLLESAPTAELHVFRDTGHNVMHDQREKFNRLLCDWCR